MKFNLLWICLCCVLFQICNCHNYWNTIDHFNSQSDEKSCYAQEQLNSCDSCLAQDNTVWCNSGRCMKYNTSYVECNGNCSSSTLSRNNCGSLVLSIIAVIFSFILLIVCPLCVFGACVIIIIARCRTYNKIVADCNDTSEPIPVLQLHSTGLIPIEAQTQPMIASARIITDAEAQQYEEEPASAFAVPVQVTGPINGIFVNNRAIPATGMIVTSISAPVSNNIAVATSITSPMPPTNSFPLYAPSHSYYPEQRS